MFTDFMSKKWKIWESFYKNEIIEYNDKKEPVHYPIPENAAKNSYEKWKADVCDPRTGEFYKGKRTEIEYDDDGNKKAEKTIETEPYFTRTQIVRIRRLNGAEYLYSRGIIAGFTQLGTEKTTDFQEPENWTETLFRRENRFIPKENRYREVVIGPTGREIIHYTLPWTPENVDKLLENSNAKTRFVLTEEGDKSVIGCPNSEMLKTKPFDYIKNVDYLSGEEKERLRKESEELQAQIVKENKRLVAK